MQHLCLFWKSSALIHSGRLLAFGIDRPPESHHVSGAKPEISNVFSDAKLERLQNRRHSRNRREKWERACEQMTDEQLLQNLGELNIEYEDSYEELHGTNETTEPDRHLTLANRIDLIEEQLADARQVWIDRRHLNQPAAELANETAMLQERLASSRALLDQLPKKSPRYAIERLKSAILEEQANLAQSSGRLAK